MQPLLTLNEFAATPSVNTVVGSTPTVLGGTFGGTQEPDTTFKWRPCGRVIRFKNNVYAWCANQIRKYNYTTTNWDTAYTLAHPNSAANYAGHTGIEVAVVSGVATMIGLYYDRVGLNWYGVKSVDGVTWTEVTLTNIGNPDVLTCGAGDHIVYQNVFYAALWTGAWAVSWDPSTTTLTLISSHLVNAITGTCLLAYNNRLFMMYCNSSFTYAIDEFSGGAWVTRFTFPESSDSSNTNSFLGAALFSDGTSNTLYSLTSSQNAGTCHWFCHALTLGTNTVSDGGDISAATLPAGIRNQTTAANDSKFIAFVDRITDPTVTTVYLLNALHVNSTTTTYKWNGSGSLITSQDSGGDIANYWPSPHYASGERAFVIGQNDVVLNTSAQVAVGGGIQISFKLYQQPGQTAVTGRVFTLYYTTDGVTLVAATISYPSAGSLSGKTITGLTADGTTTYTVIWNSAADGVAQATQVVLIGGVV